MNQGVKRNKYEYLYLFVTNLIMPNIFNKNHFQNKWQITHDWLTTSDFLENKYFLPIFVIFCCHSYEMSFRFSMYVWTASKSKGLWRTQISALLKVQCSGKNQITLAHPSCKIVSIPWLFRSITKIDYWVCKNLVDLLSSVATLLKINSWETDNITPSGSG